MFDYKELLPQGHAYFFYPIGNGMHKINLFDFYSFGNRLNIIKNIGKDDKGITTAIKLYGAMEALSIFLEASQDINFPKLRQSATDLLQFLKVVTKRLEKQAEDDYEKPLSLATLVDIERDVKSLEYEFHFASQALNVFAVSDVGTHSASKLLSEAEINLSLETQRALPDAVLLNIQEAGRCLALNLSTASAFHILRAVEPLIVEYVNKVKDPNGKAFPTKNRNWGAYSRWLEQCNADKKIIGMINHIKDFYRNPVMHPDDTLDQDQALSLFHTCLSAIEQLVLAIKTTP